MSSISGERARKVRKINFSWNLHFGPLLHFSLDCCCLGFLLLVGSSSPLHLSMCFSKPALLISSRLHFSHRSGAMISLHTFACLYMSSWDLKIAWHFVQSVAWCSSMCFSRCLLLPYDNEHALHLWSISTSSMSITTSFWCHLAHLLPIQAHQSWHF